MATADLQPVIDEITAAGTVIDGATVFVQSVPGLIQAAIDQATAGGATAAQLAPVQAVADAISAKAQALQAAMLAGTPSAPASAKHK